MHAPLPIELDERCIEPHHPDDAECTEVVPASGRLITVLGAKGGCGVTTLGVNLAGELARDQPTCLVDLDMCKGDVAGYLDLPAQRSVQTLLRSIDVLDADLIRGAVIPHNSGFDVLAQPYDLRELRMASADEIRRLLAALRQRYEVTVVDAGAHVDVTSLSAALAADELLLVVTPTVSALRDARRMIALLTQLGIPRDVLRLVANKVERGSPVPAHYIEDQLGLPLAATIARDDHACGRAETRGRLLRRTSPRARVTRDIAALWAGLHPAPVPVPTSRWPWSGR